MKDQILVNKYLPIAILYFFFNGFLLPHSLLYTSLLSPFLLIWLYKYNSYKLYSQIGLFLLILLPFAVVQFLNGVNSFYYFRSFLLLFTVFIFALSFIQYLKLSNSIRTIYKQLLIWNIPFVLLALFILTQPGLVTRFWYANEITVGIAGIRRLKMLTYEPSYYSFLFVPIALYYYLKFVILKVPNAKLVFVLVTLPLLLSLSFGVILGLTLALLFTFIYGMGNFFPGKNWPIYAFGACLLLLISGVIFLFLFPENVFVIRIANVLSGKDTSFKGRTFDSFYLGWQIARAKSVWFGCGLGQVKEIGLPYFISFYNNTSFTIEEIGIPNAVCDTLATFGILGVTLRLITEVYLFFSTKVLSNYYRFSLFAFIFIYQFTGSFIMNIAEYVIWIMAFSPGIFKEFEKTFFSGYKQNLSHSNQNQKIQIQTS
ncbi:MAG: hypothetical protein ACHQET_08400 [Chitinophagales bacterium]